MSARAAFLRELIGIGRRAEGDEVPSSTRRTWLTLPLSGQIYVAAVVVVGALSLATLVPRTYPEPSLFVMLLVFACLTSTWKVNLPIPVENGSTLSVSYAANIMSLLLLDVDHAVVIAVAGAWMQCHYKAKQPYPRHRTAFSMGMASVTMAATGFVYESLGGPTAPTDLSSLARPLVGAIATYFFVNTSLVAGAIASSTSRTFVRIWREDFQWSGTSFIVAGSAGALAAVVLARGQHWKAVLLVTPVYLTYRTYELFVGRLEDQRRHTELMQQLHEETVAALGQAREAEQALAAEKERLAAALADMTRLEARQAELLQREQAARASSETANRLKDQFLAVVSHELRTPLNAILGWAHMLRRATGDDALRERASRIIFDSAKRQAQLIEDLLDVSRIASGKLRLDRHFVDLNTVVQDAIQVVQPAADAKDIKLTLTCERSLGAFYGDGTRLQQVAWNLLSNAVKFTPEGGAVHVRLARKCNIAELVVSDTGEGISEGFLPSMFDAFRQADGSSTRVHPGLGLGLSIVKSLVEAHGGSVRAHSEGLGRGAVFTVRLPIAVTMASDALPTAAERDAEPSETASLEGLSVLVVDDDVESREIVATHLQESRAEVVTAGSAAEAFELLHRRRIDVLLADIAMPVEDGYSLIRRIRASRPDVATIPAAAVTAFAADDDRGRALRAGFHLHLSKPLDAHTLVAAVAKLGKSGVRASV